MLGVNIYKSFFLPFLPYCLYSLFRSMSSSRRRFYFCVAFLCLYHNNPTFIPKKALISYRRDIEQNSAEQEDNSDKLDTHTHAKSGVNHFESWRGGKKKGISLRLSLFCLFRRHRPFIHSRNAIEEEGRNVAFWIQRAFFDPSGSARWNGEKGKKEGGEGIHVHWWGERVNPLPYLFLPSLTQ